MAGNFLLALCALSCLYQVTPLKLTKEIELIQNADPQNPYQAFRQAILALKDVNIRREMVQLIFRSPEQAVTNLADLLMKKNNPQVEEVLDVFNAGLGTRLLVINDNYVQINADAFEGILSQTARSVTKTLYPNDYFRQMVAFSMFQRKIKEVGQEVRDVTDAKKIHVNDFAAVLSPSGHTISKRDTLEVQQRDLLSSLLETVEIAVCQSVINSIYSQFNTTVISYVSYLEGITISSSDLLSNLVAAAINLLIDIAGEVINYLNDLVESLSSSICSELISASSSRKRRDLTSLAEVSGVQTDTELVETAGRSLATRDLLSVVWSLIWSLLSSAINTVLTSLVESAITSLQSTVDAFIQDVFAAAIYNIIDAIFPA